MKKQLLLISNSIAYKQGYLDHCIQEIQSFLQHVNSILFIPFALKNYNEYEEIAKKRFEKINIKLKSIHHFKNKGQAILKSQSIFIGGGNTFKLLNEMYKYDLLRPIRQKVSKGTPYIGTSAGSNVACPTIKTTNDMPIIQPPSFKALNLIPFNINPHYLDHNPNSEHQGETREKRIDEFHQHNKVPVIGLREQAWLLLKNGELLLRGQTGAKIFIKDKKPKEYQPNSILNFLLNY